jgi:hypothetical protein
MESSVDDFAKVYDTTLNTLFRALRYQLLMTHNSTTMAPSSSAMAISFIFMDMARPFIDTSARVGAGRCVRGVQGAGV